MPISPRIALFVSLLSVALAACGGGQTQPGLRNPPPPPAPPPPPPPPPSEFDTDEFRRSWGLDAINAIPAYEAGATGEGVVVAVIDTGIDANHVDLEDQIHPASQDLVTSRPNPTIQDQDGHGTFVSGIIAAERNAIGIHGVAFDSQILALRGESEGSCSDEEGCSFSDLLIAEGVGVAIDNGARVISLSLGGEAPLEFLLDRFRQAAAAGLVIVMSAGNDSAANPTDFALSALDPEIAGSMIIVGASNRNNQLAGFSNQAGIARDFFVVAPGQDVISTFLGGGTAIGSGTSFSAPYVAGAAAVLFDLFPNLSGADVVDILLSTADDLGTLGVDDTFGHGIIDLEAALQPQGEASIASLADGDISMHPVTETLLQVAPALGDALRNSTLFDDVVMLDSYNRAYRFDLGERILPRHTTTPVLHSLFQQSQYVSGAHSAGRGTRFSYGALARDRGADGFVHALAEAERRQLQRRQVTALLETGLGSAAKFKLGVGLAPDTLLADRETRQSKGGFLWARGDDHLSLVPTEWRAGASAALRLTDRLSVAIAAATGEARSPLNARLSHPGANEPNIHAVQARTSLDGSRMRLWIDIGTISETGGFLGAFGSGGFAASGSTRTLYGRVTSQLDIGRKSRLQLEFAMGTSALQGPLSRFITRLNGLRTSSFRASFERLAIFVPRDRLAIALAQPMRLESGRATAVLPVGMNFKTETLIFETRSAPIASSGREIALELVYERPLFDSLVMSANLVHQRNPGHVFGASPATSALIRLSGRF